MDAGFRLLPSAEEGPAPALAFRPPPVWNGKLKDVWVFEYMRHAPIFYVMLETCTAVITINPELHYVPDLTTASMEGCFEQIPRISNCCKRETSCC